MAFSHKAPFLVVDAAIQAVVLILVLTNRRGSQVGLDRERPAATYGSVSDGGKMTASMRVALGLLLVLAPSRGGIGGADNDLSDSATASTGLRRPLPSG